MIRNVLAASKAALQVVLVVVREDRLRRAIQELLTAVLARRVDPHAGKGDPDADARDDSGDPDQTPKRPADTEQPAMPRVAVEPDKVADDIPW